MSTKLLWYAHSNRLHVGFLLKGPRGPKLHTGLRQGPLSDVPRGLRPRTPKSIFHYFSSISLSAIQVNGRDSETGPISAPHSAVLKRFRKQLGAPNFGGQFRGRKRQRLQSFEVLRPIVSEREMSHSRTNRVAV